MFQKRSANATAELFQVQQSIACEQWSLTAGQVLAVAGGARGRTFNSLLERGILVAIDRPRAGVEPVNFTPAALDVQPRKAPVRPAPVPHADVLERFRWNQGDMDRATTLIGFPRPAGKMITRRGPVPVWDERDLTAWADAVKTFAGGLR